MSVYHVAYGLDSNYWQHFGASITSLLLNFEGEGEALCIHLLTDAPDAPFAAKLKQLQNRFRATIEVYAPSSSAVDGLTDLPPTVSYHSKAAYLNILLAEMLPEEVDKVLFLDADTIVLSDIQELFTENMSGKTLAGVDDFSSSAMAKYWSVSDYINSGVMLVDMRRWREFEYTKKCLAFAFENNDKLKYVDQCAVNMVLAGDIKRLAPKWNGFVMPGRTNGDLDKAAILHYITANKPWQSWYDHPLGKHYWRFLEVSPWAGSAPVQPKTLNEAIRMARLLSHQGKQQEAVVIYENVLKAIARNNDAALR